MKMFKYVGLWIAINFAVSIAIATLTTYVFHVTDPLGTIICGVVGMVSGFSTSIYLIRKIYETE